MEVVLVVVHALKHGGSRDMAPHRVRAPIAALEPNSADRHHAQ
jgi:hypothetical protein